MRTEKEFNGLYFDENTSVDVCRVISTVNRNTRIRVWYGKDGKSWNEENDITGYVGRSTGTKKIPLLINNSRSFGGGALLCGSIVKIVETATNNVLYQHPAFSQSVFTVSDGDMSTYAANVLQDGELYGRCKTFERAKRLSDFMNGKRHNK